MTAAALRRRADAARRMPPTSADVADLLRCRPQPGDPAELVAAWVARKRGLLAAIERATR